ncbi:MAG: hypothetical protein QGH39_02040, partial [Candidatus Thermoplasmatota archaeon]|nr:hypothetical protein [Candidatus Thermoplasmatota archaeon]
VEQVFKKIDVMKGFGGDEGIASENEMIKFLPMRTSVRPRKQKKKRGKGRKRRSINRSRKSPLVAAAAMEDELEGEKTTNFFTCPKCDEVLEVAISVKEGPLNERYTISCPMCNTKGDLVIE